MTIETRLQTEENVVVPGAAASTLRVLLLLSIAAASACGFAFGALRAQGAAPAEMEAELANLLRAMALIKLGLAAGCAWLVDWRLRQPCDRRLALGYVAAVALVMAPPGMIWFVTDLGFASVLFHSGLLLGLVLAFRDRGLPERSRAARE
jgi:hypothetical protein